MTKRKFLLLLTRTLHIYVSMFGLILLIFFAFTGFVMNHEGWFALSEPRVSERTSTAPVELAGAKDANAHLAVVEYLRAHEGARGEVSSYDEDEDSVRVQFAAPARKTDFTLTRTSGDLAVHEETRNSFAFLADLHMGKATGAGWKLMIDGAALLLLFASLSGLVLWISIKKRRTIGLVALAVSLALCAVFLFLLLP